MSLTPEIDISYRFMSFYSIISQYNIEGGTTQLQNYLCITQVVIRDKICHKWNIRNDASTEHNAIANNDTFITNV